MKFFAGFSLMGAVCATAAIAGKVQIMVVYQHTTGMIKGSAFKSAFIEGLETSLAKLSTSDIEIGLASFTDKPAPSVGIGSYGGYPDVYSEDWCYKRELAFTTDLAAIGSSLNQVREGAGLDVQQAQLEATVVALYDAEWDMSIDTDRVVMLVTDGWAHSGEAGGHLTYNVGLFNQPVRCTSSEATAGGFGAVNQNVGDYAWGAQPTEIRAFAALNAKKACSSDPLSASELESYENALSNTYPLVKYPEVLPFDLQLVKSSPEEHCRFNEYPTYAEVKAAFADLSAKWVVVHAEAEGQYSPTTGETWQYTVNESTYGFAPTPMAVANLVDRRTVTASEFTAGIDAAFQALSIGY